MSTLATDPAAEARTASPAPAHAPGDLLESVRADLVRRPGPVDVPRIARLLQEQGRVVGASRLLEITAAVRDHVEGLGPLQGLIAPGITDILVNDDGSTWVEDGEGLRPTGIRLGDAAARDLAVRLATAGGRRLDDAMPWADAHLPSGARFHAVLPPLSPGGAIISLRLPGAEQLDLDALQRRGAFGAPVRAVLGALVTSRIPFLITGGTGSGKSTLLAAMLQEAPQGERMIIVEDALELSVPHPHVVHLQSRHANAEGAGEVDLATLVRQCLRMRPDRIVLGECRGPEIRELLQALNTGHEGGCGTVHANTAGDVPARLEALGALAGLDREALAAQVTSALRVVVHLSRADGVRRVEEISLLDRDEHGLLRSRTALRSSREGLLEGPAAAPLAEHLRRGGTGARAAVSWSGSGS